MKNSTQPTVKSKDAVVLLMTLSPRHTHAVTLPIAERSSPFGHTELHALVTEAHVLASAAGETRTRDLSITSPTL